MTNDQIKRLQPYVHFWEILKATGHFPDPSSDGLKIIADVWQEVFNKTAQQRHKQMSCGGCISDLIKQIFNHYEQRARKKR